VVKYRPYAPHPPHPVSVSSLSLSLAQTHSFTHSRTSPFSSCISVRIQHYNCTYQSGCSSLPSGSQVWRAHSHIELPLLTAFTAFTIAIAIALPTSLILPTTTLSIDDGRIVALCCLRTFSYRSAALVCRTRPLATAPAECKDSDCSGMRLHERTGSLSTLATSIPCSNLLPIQIRSIRLSYMNK
jgi:hypothetical protein